MHTRRIALLAAVSTATFAALAVAQASGTTPAFGSGTPGFAISSAPASFGQADLAGEPSIGIDWRTGAGMYMDDTNVLKLDFDRVTGAATWSNASALRGLTQNVDPILTTDPVTGRTLAGGDTGACSALYASSDDGQTWLPSLPCTFTYDHPTVAYAPSGTTPGATVFFYCQQGPVAQHCETSSDEGTVWTPATPSAQVSTAVSIAPEMCIGPHGHLRGSTDGTAYLPGKSCFRSDGNTGVGGMSTSDDGTTWSEYLIPGQTSTAFDPAVATTPDNKVFEAWEGGASYHPMIAVSGTHGSTWSQPFDLAGTVSPALVASSLPTLVTGDNGRIAYSFLGSSVGSGNPNAPGFHGIWYLYTSFSYDGGHTWTTVRDTPTPVQYGEIDGGGTSTGGQRNLLDFIDSALTKDGRVVVAFADGCPSVCEQATSQASAEAASTHAWASVAYQTAGTGLYDAPPLSAARNGAGPVRFEARLVTR